MANNKDPKAPAALVPVDPRFSAASNGTLYVACGFSSLYAFPKGKSETVKVNLGVSHGIISDVLVDQVDLGYGAPEEVLWLADSSSGVLRVARLKSPGNPAYSINPAPAGLAPLYAQKQGRDTFTKPISFARLSSPALIILDAPNTSVGSMRFRHLDLETWVVSTICTWDVPSALGNHLPHLYPLPIEEPLYADEVEVCANYVQIYRPKLDPMHLSIETREVLVQTGKHAYLPIGDHSSPMYIRASKSGIEGVVRLHQGLLEAAVPSEPISAIGHVSSTGFTAIFRQGSFGSTTLPWRLVTPVHLPTIDLSCLINNEALLQDLELANPWNGVIWKLEKDDLVHLHPSIDVERLKRVVADSQLPQASIDAFVSYLFHKHDLSRSWKTSSILWCHIIHLCDKAGLRKLVHNLVTGMIPHLSSEELCSTLVNAWNDEKMECQASDALIQHLAAQVKRTQGAAFTNFAASKASDKNTRLVGLVAGHSGQAPPAVNDFYPTGPRSFEVSIEELPYPPTPTSFFSNSTDFVFSLKEPQDQSVAIVADMRRLFGGWPYFQKLMEMGGDEAQRRHAIMPASITITALRALLSCLHSVEVIPLSKKDNLILLEHRRELYLVDADDVPHPRFEGLIKRAIDSNFPALTAANCIAQLVEYHRLDLARRIQAVIAFIAASDVPCLFGAAVRSCPLDLWMNVHTSINNVA